MNKFLLQHIDGQGQALPLQILLMSLYVNIVGLQAFVSPVVLQAWRIELSRARAREVFERRSGSRAAKKF
jgi:hypothetical protein